MQLSRVGGSKINSSLVSKHAGGTERGYEGVKEEEERGGQGNEGKEEKKREAERVYAHQRQPQFTSSWWKRSGGTGGGGGSAVSVEHPAMPCVQDGRD